MGRRMAERLALAPPPRTAWKCLRRGEALPVSRRVFASGRPSLWFGDLGNPRSIMPDWIITGGENGAHFRPVNRTEFRGLRDQCVTAGAFLFKQWGRRSQREIKAKRPRCSMAWSMTCHPTLTPRPRPVAGPGR